LPFKVVLAPPKIIDVNCPICGGKVRVQLPDVAREGDTAMGSCDHCGNYLTVTKDGLKVTTAPEEARNRKVMEKCPNCQTAWEIWILPSKALVKVYGATRLPMMNYRCDTCQCEVAYIP
jgi:ribosome-binding protein aMBF1 (putative translation factor)